MHGTVYGTLYHQMGEKANPLWRRAAALHFFTFHFSLFTLHSSLAPAGLAVLRFPRRKPAPQPGTLRWGDFCSGKSHQNPLRAFPPKDPPGVRGCPCVKPKFGPSPLLWRLAVPPHQATLGSWPYGWVVSTSGPTLEERRSRRREHGRTPCYGVVGAGLARPAATPALPWKIREGQAPPLRPKIKIRAVGTP